MPTRTLSLLLALLVASAAGAAPTSESSANHFKQCHSMDCRVPAGDMTPPDGARLSFSQCDDGVTEDYVFELRQGAWQVVSYAMSKATACKGKDEV